MFSGCSPLGHSMSGQAAYLITAAQAAISFVCQQGPPVAPVRRVPSMAATASPGSGSGIRPSDDPSGELADCKIGDTRPDSGGVHECVGEVVYAYSIKHYIQHPLHCIMMPGTQLRREGAVSSFEARER
jgi:hypothetical protein